MAMRCWPQLLLAAAVLLIALDATMASSHNAVLADDEGVSVQPGQPIVTIASLNRAPKRAGKQHKRHPGLGRKGHRAELTVSTTQHAGPLARWRAGRKARQQQKQAEADLDHQAAAQAAAAAAAKKDNKGQAAAGKKQGVVTPPAPSVVSKTTETAAGSTGGLQQKHAATQQPADSDTGAEEADAGEAEAAEEEELAEDESDDSEETADADSSSSSKSSSSKKASSKKPQHKAAPLKQGSAAQHTSKPAKSSKAKQQAADEEEEDKVEEEAELVDIEAQEAEDASILADSSGGSDADSDADDASSQEDSSDADEQEDGEEAEEAEEQQQEQKTAHKKGGSSSSKTKKKTASSGSAAPKTKNSKQGSTSSSSSSSSSSAQPGSAAGGKDAAPDMPWTLTRKSKTISLGLPGHTDDDGPSDAAAANPAAPQEDTAAARKDSSSTLQQPAKAPGNSQGAAGTKPPAAAEADSNMVLLDDVPESNTLEVPRPGQVQSAPQAALNVNAMNAAAAMEAAVNSLGLSFKGTSASTGDSSSSKLGHTKAQLLAVSMDGPLAAGQQDQGAAGQLGESALHSATSQVVQARDVMLKLAGKPQLLQYVQQKQVRQLADTLDGADVAAISALPGLMGMPKLYRAGDDIDSQLYAKKNALAVAIILFAHMSPDQLVTLLSTVVPDYVTPGVAFEELNKRLYEAPAAEKLDELYDSIMPQKGTTASSTTTTTTTTNNASNHSASVSIAAVGRPANVSKASKVAAYLVLGLLMRARVLG